MIFNFNWYDLKAFAQNERQAAKLQQIYNAAISEAARLAASLKLDPNVPFSFNKFPRLKKQVEALFQQMAQQIELTINKGSADAWALANAKNDKFLEFLAGKTGHKKSYLKNKYNYGVRNQEGLKAFQTRKTDGLSLSQRVWKYASQAQSEIELAIDGALELGSSADSLSRRVKQYLNHPDKLFRRVRDKYGNLVPSKAMKIFNPGQGVYRSSHKNAMRLARTEINMAYREADYQRWSKMDFVRGIQIKLSNNPNHCPTCQKLAGVYPKAFKFVGWHPQCRCFAVPYLVDQDAFVASLLSEEPPKVDYITELPANFNSWHKDNADKIGRAKSLPYFLRDNKNTISASAIKEAKFSKLEGFVSKLKHSPIEYNEVFNLKKELSETEIISRVGGGDMTKGSCSSLAFAYAGNKCGFDVLDFRDGSSRMFFSSGGNITNIAEGVGGKVVKSSNDFAKANELLSFVEKGKEYYFTSGKHAAIVRKTDKGFEYLELQSATSNGFKPLNITTLKDRFGAVKLRKVGKIKVETPDCLIDIDSLKNDPLFKELLGFINTNEANQMKGIKGTIK